MSEFLEDPSILTKDKLKNELQANNVALPSGEHKKDVYVQLYLKNLTAQNKKNPAPDAFSSDEDLPPPVVSNKSRSGRKATRKTDKPRPDDVDVADLTDDGLKDQLLKYGINPGPIVASTRKLYEKKLQKLLDQGPPEATLPVTAPPKEDGNQNGNTDSDQYSDKEEEEQPAPEPEPEPVPEPVPVLERPVRSRGKTQVTLRTHRYGANRHNLVEDEHQPAEQDAEQDEEQPPLNVKRRVRRPPHWRDQTVPASDDTDMSESSTSEPVSLPHKVISPKPHKQDFLPQSPQIPSKPARPSSFTHSDQSMFKHSVQTTLDSADLLKFLPHAPGKELRYLKVSKKESPSSKLSQRLLEKPLHRPHGDSFANHPAGLRNLQRSTLGDGIGRSSPLKEVQKSKSDDKASPALAAPVKGRLSSLFNTALLEDSLESGDSYLDTPYVEKQLTAGAALTVVTPKMLHAGLCTPVGRAPRWVDERPVAEDPVPTMDGKDILKEMFPNEVSTPTGIRRPIRGAAGRPLKPIDFWLDESLLRRTERLESHSYTETRSTPRLAASSAAVSASSRLTAAPPSVHSRARRSLPVWVQLLLLSAVAGFLFFVYQAMETNPLNPFNSGDVATASGAGGGAAD